MSLTKREYITNQYNSFNQEIFPIVNNNNLLPSLDDVDLCDLITYFNYTFGNTNNYDSIIIQLLKSNNVRLTEQEFHKLIPIFNKYINQIKSVI